MEERFISHEYFGGGGARVAHELYVGSRMASPHEYSGSCGSSAARAVYAQCSSSVSVAAGMGTAASASHGRPPPRNESIGELANAIGRSLAGEIAGLETSGKNARSSPLHGAGTGAVHAQGRNAPALSGLVPALEPVTLSEDGFLPHAANGHIPAAAGPAATMRHPHSSSGDGPVPNVGIATPRHHQAWSEHYSEAYRAQGRTAANSHNWMHVEASHRYPLENNQRSHSFSGGSGGYGAGGGGGLAGSAPLYERQSQHVPVAAAAPAPAGPPMHDESSDDGEMDAAAAAVSSGNGSGSSSANGGGGAAAAVRFLDQSWTAVLQSAAGSDLLPFLRERESRALVLCGCSGVPTDKIRFALEKHGRLYYLRDDFAARGAVFAAFFDIRAAVSAQKSFSRDMQGLLQNFDAAGGGGGAAGNHTSASRPPAAAYFSVILHGASSHKEGTLVVRDLPPHVTEGEVLAAFQAYGGVRGVWKQISLQPGHTGSFFIDYFDIQDAKRASEGLGMANPWGQRLAVEPASRGEKERLLAQQLVAMLMRWREEIRQQAFAQLQRHANCPDYASCRNGGAAGGPGCLSDLTTCAKGPGLNRFGDGITPATSANTTPSTTPASTPPTADSYPGIGGQAVVVLQQQQQQQQLQQQQGLSAASVAAAAAAGRSGGNRVVMATTSPPPQAQYDARAALLSQPHSQQQQQQQLQQQQQQQQLLAENNMRQGSSASVGGGGGGAYSSAHYGSCRDASLEAAYPGGALNRRNSAPAETDDEFLYGGVRNGANGVAGYHSHSPPPLPPHASPREHSNGNSPPLRPSGGSPTNHMVAYGPYNGGAKAAVNVNGNVGGGIANVVRREGCGAMVNGGGNGNGNGPGACVGAGGGGGSSCDEFGLDLKKIAKGLDKRTTIMIRNIPNKYTQAMLLREIDANFREAYDFFYLPIDFKNKCNVGYAFINFMDYRRIVPFFREFNGQRWKNFNSEKVCAITYARIQGKASMISRFQNSSLMEKDGEYRPLLFCSNGAERGRPEPFPIATKARRFNPCHAGGAPMVNVNSLNGNVLAVGVVLGGGGGAGEARGMSGASLMASSGVVVVGGVARGGRGSMCDRERARSSSAAPNLPF